jgi:hypothetical protein
VTIFEKITQDQETLAAMLASLPTSDGPWDYAFQLLRCNNCANENCDVCPHETERNNPLWWLGLDVPPEGEE